MVQLKRYIRCNSDIQLQGNSKSYFRNIRQILNDKNIILDNIENIENPELVDIMMHKTKDMI